MADVVIMCDYYLPGYRAGGPIRSLAGVAETEPHRIRIVTRNRDMNSDRPYDSIEPGTWVQVGNAEVCYLDLRPVRWIRVLRQLRSEPLDILYINSLHSVLYSLLPMLMLRGGFITPRYLMIAPRGECSVGALDHRRWKKLLARGTMRWMFSKHLIWHVSSEQEGSDVLRWWGGSLPAGQSVLVYTNPSPQPSEDPRRTPGVSGLPVVAFASRIDPMKGLLEAIEVVSEVSVKCIFRIHGTTSSEKYWHACETRLAQLPPHIVVEVRGDFQPQELAGLLRDSDLFLLPTKGENFGHAIATALATGCPVAISDRTMWSNIVRAAGGVATNDLTELSSYVNWFCSLNDDERVELRRRTTVAYKMWYATHGVKGSLFSEAIRLSSEMAPRG